MTQNASRDRVLLGMIGGSLLALTAAPELARGQSAAPALVTAAVAAHFFPKNIRTADGENCIAPASSSGGGAATGVAFYRAVPHPENPAAIWLMYALTFNDDCGHAGHKGSPGAEAHPWDVEFFSYTLEADPKCANGLRAHALKTRAHSGTFERREINERILDSCSGVSEIVMSLGKHALYPSWADCSKRTPAEYCSGAAKATADYNLYSFANFSTLDPSVKGMLTSKAQRQLQDPAVEFSGKLEHPHHGLGDNPAKCAGDQRCAYGSSCSASLCYKACEDGYSGSGAFCYSDCPAGWKGGSDTFSCFKDRESRSPHSSKHNCQQDGKYDCNKHGLLWYRACDPGYSWDGSGCTADCVGMTDSGAFCTKKTKARGVGILP